MRTNEIQKKKKKIDEFKKWKKKIKQKQLNMEQKKMHI